MDDALRNSDTNRGMFIAAMSLSLAEEDLVEAFEAETGWAIFAPRSPIDVMVDDQLGTGLETMKAFARWFAENHWGVETAPDIDPLFRGPASS